MRIYVSVDLEGIYGVNKYDIHADKNREYQKWKKEVGKLMREEVLVLYKGLYQKGINEILVFDHHGSSDTLNLPNNLPNLRQISRLNTENVLFPALDSEISALIFWGYHVKSGSISGKLNHTTSRRIKFIKINGKEVGEVYLYGLYAHHYGIPIIAASGDPALKFEINTDIGKIPFFNSDSGKELKREMYLNSIKDFFVKLNIGEIIKYNQNIKWPEKTEMQVSYKNPIINIGRWMLRKQFLFSKLKGFSSCIYSKGSFIEQFNYFNGYS